MEVRIEGVSPTRPNRLADVSRKSIDVVFENIGDRGVRFPCPMIAQYGLDIVYSPSEDPADDWMLNGPPPADSYPAPTLLPSQQCRFSYPLDADGIALFLKATGQQAVDVRLAVSLPDLPQTAGWAGLRQTMAFRVVRGSP
ncbi:hypothetical protein RPE78_05740 [Thioclava litoralis]|uniref:Uncharacterized protein n=1 Tax=Thioclava litoralis TaxID=3076557 RepID=A0ABZ1E145_9RHOB|nr:hypothetical protein RPE78_05740 [Thioclava sp. FTW29]